MVCNMECVNAVVFTQRLVNNSVMFGKLHTDHSVHK